MNYTKINKGEKIMVIYGLYDLKNKEQVIIVGNLKEIMKYLKITARGINKYLRGQLIENRYKLEFCYREEL